MPLDLKKLKLLIVEDNDPMRNLMSSVLKHLGARTVFTATSGKEGFEVFTKNKPDIVISDWEMEQWNGLELTKQIRSNTSSLRSTPIIMISGYSAVSRVTAARDSGVNDFLVKPYTASAISKRIADVINKPRDFIDCPTFVGPDRRRRKSDDFDNPRRQNDKEAVEKENTQSLHPLQVKAGFGEIELIFVEASQKEIEGTKVSFFDMSEKLIELLKKSVLEAKSKTGRHDAILSKLAMRVMSIKASAGMFGCPLASRLSAVLLEFIDSQRDVDEDILLILDVYSEALDFIANNRISDEAVYGLKMVNELENAIKRYYAKRKPSNL